MIAMTSWFTRAPRNAAEWVARMHSGTMSTADHVALEAWLAHRPENRRDYDKIRSLWTMAQDLQSSGTARAYLAQDRARRRSAAPRSRPLVLGLGLGLAAAMVALTVLPLRDVYATGAGEIRTVTLDDGSTVWLNGDSRLRIDFSAPIRRVVLERGEAFFKVAHDANRPFVVEAEPQRITVTGTEFDVRRAPASVEVSVSEGHVIVDSPVAHEMVQPATALAAGDDAHFATGQTMPAVAHSAPVQHKGAWREGKVYLDNLHLDAALEEINRYSRTKVILAADEKLTPAEEKQRALMIDGGPWKIGDVEEMLFGVETTYGLEARHEAGRIVLHRKGE
jgi:transmembrane sensor